MNQKKSQTIGWQFDNSYAQLPEHFYTKMPPAGVSAPKLVVVNHALAAELGLDFGGCDDMQLAEWFAGNVLPEGAEPLAQAYAGHQFGNFTVLGDGRAHLIGEQITPAGQRVDIQLKGSGKTPYGRRGDGWAALGPMLREYVISEAMHALGVASTRSLAVVTTGDPVYREQMLPGAILTRVASSHVRVGTFELLAANKDRVGLKKLADYTIKRHYPELEQADAPYLELVRAVMERQIGLVVDWLRVGFIHGVMNTDNMVLSGETIDYGPCAFMDGYDPKTVFSSIDQLGRYAYGNQPHIAQWNLARLAEALLPLIDDDIEQAAVQAEELIESFNDAFQKAWLGMMRQKLGLHGQEEEDNQLIGDWLQWMQRHEADYTNSFDDISQLTMPQGKPYDNEQFELWWQRWHARRQLYAANVEASVALMQAQNPAIIPRNHQVQQALDDAEEHLDFTKLHALLAALQTPYDRAKANAAYRQPPLPDQRVYYTFCGT